MKVLNMAFQDVYKRQILDTPPVNAVTDSKILSTKVDGTILVVKYGYTKKDAVIEAVKGLRAVKANIIGTVFNGEESQRGKYYHYYKKD